MAYIMILLNFLIRKNYVKNKTISFFLKNEQWEKLAAEFSAGCSSAPRSAKILKAKYKNMKKDYRTYKGKIRQSQYATGGGPATDIKPYPFEEDMGELLTLSAEGAFNMHDGDRAVGRPNVMPEAEYSSEVDLVRQTCSFLSS